MLREAGLAEKVSVDSAGTIGMHHGKLPDHRMRRSAANRGFELTSRARRIESDDLEVFDLILTMDASNRRNVMALAQTETQRARVRDFASFCTRHQVTMIPDPYGGGPADFEHALDLIEDGCKGVVEWVKTEGLTDSGSVSS
jgi:protein-tyrosine phosphatase